MSRAGMSLPADVKPERDHELILRLRWAIDGRGEDAGLGRVTDHALGYLLAAVEGDVELAADAATMRPRPAWVEEFLGPA